MNKNYTCDKPIFKEYILRQYIGEGAYGRVYLVENNVGQAFALKVLFKDVQAEQRGVQAVMKINSNRLVRLIDYGETVKGDFCVLMEYMKECLSSIMKKPEPMDENTAISLFREIMEGLRVLEANAVIHRDIKPSNLFLLENIIKIGDFGTAKYTSGESASKTRTVTTLHYSAPESFHNKHDFSADRWAAAVVFYRMLTGRLPFDGDNQAGVIGAIMMYEPDFDSVPDRFAAFLKKCFDKEKAKRFENVDAMMEAFARCERNDYVLESRPKTSVKKSGELRSTPMTVSAEDATKEFPLKKVENWWKPKSYVKNDFVDNGDGTILDRSTGLLWQKSGSPKNIDYASAGKYIEQLNLEKFAGRNDWRLPTVDELITLLEENRSSNGLYTDSLFDRKQLWCWTADRHPKSSGSAWFVYFPNGSVYWSNVDYSVRAVCPRQ